jgi:Flp pilus assembly protein TadD
VALVRDTDPEDASRRLEQLLNTYPRTASAANDLAVIMTDRGELDRAKAYAYRATWLGLPEAEATTARIRKLRGDAVPAKNVAVETEPSPEP